MVIFHFTFTEFVNCHSIQYKQYKVSEEPEEWNVLLAELIISLLVTWRWQDKTGGAIRPAKGGIDFFCYFFVSRQKSK